MLENIVRNLKKKESAVLGIRTLHGPLQTADLRRPCIFYLFLIDFEIRTLRGPFMRRPQVDNKNI